MFEDCVIIYLEESRYLMCTNLMQNDFMKNIFAATLFLELWKNYSAEITHRWDLTSLDIHEEHPRPKYLARLAHVKKKSVNFVTNTVEPSVPFWKVRLPATIFSCSVVLLLVSFTLLKRENVIHKIK